MKLFKRIISILTVLSLTLSLAGCFDPSKIADKHTDGQVVNDTSYEPVEDIKFNLPYISGDTLNPFTAKTEINRRLTPLLYDSLYAVGNDFKAIPLLAKSAITVGNNLVVTIKPEQKFSDGSSVTVTDIVYSFEKAKESERYQNSLSCFEKADATNNYEVTFYTSSTKIDLINLLTFPIVKALGSEADEYTENTVEENDENSFIVPVGSGRYFLTKDKNNITYLCANTSRLGGYFPKYRNIGLQGTVDFEKISSMYSLGRTNIIMDTYDTGEYIQTIGNSEKITLPNFIYLCLNSQKESLKDPIVRKAISYALDRKELCDFSFISNASAAELPFHPDYYKTVKIKPENKTYNDAVSLLDNNGYNQINNVYNFRYNSEDSSKVLEFRLAVCRNNTFKVSAAEKIKEQLAKVNIRIEIYSYGEEDFFNVISSGAYDMYIGETKLNNNLDISGFFTSGNILSTGINTLCDSAAAYTAYQNSETGIEEFIKVFKEDLPFIPLLYRNGNIYSNSLMNVPDKAIVTDYYYNTENWKTADD